MEVFGKQGIAIGSQRSGDNDAVINRQLVTLRPAQTLVVKRVVQRQNCPAMHTDGRDSGANVIPAEVQFRLQT